MPSSKDLPPSAVPFFPTQFIRNQFCSKPKYLPSDTDLSNQVAIITGSNTGLGYECARQFLSHKVSELILAVRSAEKGEGAANKLRKKYPNATIKVWHLDMSSYESVKEFVARVEKELHRLDIAILNAGVAPVGFKTAPETGHEDCVQVNYLSTMLLSILLLPVLKRMSPDGVPGRLTIITSMLSMIAKFANKKEIPLLPAFDNEKLFDAYDIYPTSKFLCQMFFWKLSDLVSADDVVMNLVEPGFIKGTELQRDLNGVGKMALGLLKAASARSVQVGVSTYLDAVVAKGKESHGCVLMNWDIFPYPSFMYSPEGKEVMGRLWDETMKEFSSFDVDATLKFL
ncbi:hypothetical protein N7448_002494 [Penicillium atrosanguineum]|uniref:Uncharacterized protein n=1 Tax=Penicillium atrosanguineum TaxID=1132637 RepID=A0A9W9PVP2_9EURO|nr:Histone h1.3 [Penicillium atrosanguineum]KAJ5128781.1 hypothetical protein N7526_006947 [Penicillium atrosanguineum]KAJ5145102.1 hypothetical protein N7448_002494 [Penicillium atrosanguineum]KAJ5300893.1 Histone h1.3 [Penicillium atrosanguineum]KAJ5311538.1 hypothetical protein N7476_007398 [Penicillium atrosanguineum]